MVALPAVTPVTTPVLGFTVATAVLLLLHTPPAGVALKVVVPPTIVPIVPLITGVTGLGNTVTLIVLLLPPQPLAAVKVTV